MRSFLLNLTLGIFCLICISCNLQYYSLKESTKETSNTSFGKKKERIKVNFVRRIENGKNHLYNSFQSDFELTDSYIFDKKNKSALILSYTTTTIDNKPGLTGLWFLFSLGVLPAISDSSSVVYFDLTDSKSGKLIKDYKYRIDGWGVSSWFTIPFAIVLPWVHDGFAKSPLVEFSEKPQKLIMQQFQKDITTDLEKNKELYEEIVRISQETKEE